MSRCGIASAVLECFMGASYDEVVADYLVTYYNYYGIQPGTEKAANIAKYGIVSALQTMFGVKDLSRADLQAEALDYCWRSAERRGDRLPPADAQRPARLPRGAGRHPALQRRTRQYHGLFPDGRAARRV